MAHPSWVCGLKLHYSGNRYYVFIVTPFVGVWIETVVELIPSLFLDVTPFVGVWIETSSGGLDRTP